MEARDEWPAAWRGLGAAEPPAGVLEALVAAYVEPGRAYHNLRHLDECFAHLAAVRPLLDRPAEVGLALWFHDAVYDPRRRDNEARSAAWAEGVLGGAGLEAAAATVRDLILLTADHAPPSSADGRILVDVDLAILGAPPARFDEYEDQIRREYYWVADADFRAGRAQVLRRFAARSPLYLTEHFRRAIEGPARANLARSLARLDTG